MNFLLWNARKLRVYTIQIHEMWDGSYVSMGHKETMSDNIVMEIIWSDAAAAAPLMTYVMLTESVWR